MVRRIGSSEKPLARCLCRRNSKAWVGCGGRNRRCGCGLSSWIVGVSGVAWALDQKCCESERASGGRVRPAARSWTVGSHVTVTSVHRWKSKLCTLARTFETTSIGVLPNSFPAPPKVHPHQGPALAATAMQFSSHQTCPACRMRRRSWARPTQSSDTHTTLKLSLSGAEQGILGSVIDIPRGRLQQQTCPGAFQP
jgi:hypothetical protein